MKRRSFMQMLMALPALALPVSFLSTPKKQPKDFTITTIRVSASDANGEIGGMTSNYTSGLNMTEDEMIDQTINRLLESRRKWGHPIPSPIGYRIEVSREVRSRFKDVHYTRRA